jgi:hypothetical protein
MLSQSDEYKSLVGHRLAENMKSFKLLFGMQHYGNCISIMCQELDQIIRILFLLNSNFEERKGFIQASIDSHKWSIKNKENKREFINDEMLLHFAGTLEGWDRGIYEFGIAFKNLSNNFNYGSRDPIKSMGEAERLQLSRYIQNFHQGDFPGDFTLETLIPILPVIIDEISAKLKSYLDRI